MSLIQLVLVSAALFSLIIYLNFFRSVFRDRLFAVVLFCSAVLATLFPDATTYFAQKLGVGRGTDLIFYLFAVTSVFVAILFYSKLSRLERVQTELARDIAINNAQTPEQSPKI